MRIFLPFATFLVLTVVNIAADDDYGYPPVDAELSSLDSFKKGLSEAFDIKSSGEGNVDYSELSVWDILSKGYKNIGAQANENPDDYGYPPLDGELSGSDAFKQSLYQGLNLADPYDENTDLSELSVWDILQKGLGNIGGDNEENAESEGGFWESAKKELAGGEIDGETA